jgi:hypothetical protein
MSGEADAAIPAPKEKQLLAALAGVKSEFGLPDRYHGARLVTRE